MSDSGFKIIKIYCPICCIYFKESPDIHFLDKHETINYSYWMWSDDGYTMHTACSVEVDEEEEYDY